VTQRVVLIGKPLKRRHSAVMHNAAFAAAGIDARYEAVELEPDEVALFVEQARGEGWLGLQVTAPYKKVVAGLVDEVEPDAGARRLTIGNRTLPATVGDLAAVALDGPDFLAAVRSADLAVNATTVGMVDPGITIPVHELPAHATVFDLVYVPRETPLLAAARARGLKSANGEEMLIQQAAIAFERWTGVGGMDSVMREAVAPLFADPNAHA